MFMILYAVYPLLHSSPTVFPPVMRQTVLTLLEHQEIVHQIASGG